VKVTRQLESRLNFWQNPRASLKEAPFRKAFDTGTRAQRTGWAKVSRCSGQVGGVSRGSLLLLLNKEYTSLMGGGISTREMKNQTLASETIRITMDEVLKHNLITDSWTIYNGHVYDLTQFVHSHPGGSVSVMKASGKDCTEIFQKIHPTKNFDDFLGTKCLGTCESKVQKINLATSPPPPTSSSTSQRRQSDDEDERVHHEVEEKDEIPSAKCDSPATSWRKYCDRVSKKTTQSLNIP
jgi:cytochrome b involved in lipid metabolism